MTSNATANTQTTRPVEDLGTCDYLVIGSGAASMAFIDTILTEQPDAKIVLVDKHRAPGGHWNDAYPYVHLHQPSLLYGVSSKQLEGNWLVSLLWKWMLPWNHRASKAEVLQYYQQLVNEWEKNGKVRYFPNCKYRFYSTAKTTDNQNFDGEKLHEFNSMVDESQSYRVRVDKKLVNGVLGEPIVPSTSPVQFHVDDGIPIWTPNQLHEYYQEQVQEQAKETQGILSRFFTSAKTTTQKKRTYTVLGCGKTGMDTIVYLQRNMNVPPKDISWVIPNDVWMMCREGDVRKAGGGPWGYPQAILENDRDFDAACQQLEADGFVARLDKTVKPTKFRFPVIGADELELLRKIPVQNIVRGRGRVSCMNLDADGKNIRVSFSSSNEPWVVPIRADNNKSDEYDDHVFIHCTSPGPFNGVIYSDIFKESEKALELSILFAPPVPFSTSCIAKLESENVNGRLDLDFGRRLLVEGQLVKEVEAAALSGHDILRMLIRPLYVGDEDSTLVPIKTLAIFCGLFPDPMTAYQWMKENRLSFFSIPMFRGRVYENTCKLAEKYKMFGFTDSEGKMFALLADRLKPLEGL